MSLAQRVKEIVLDRGLDESPEPFTLSSGETSNHFIDAKAALSRGSDLAIACRAMIEAVDGVPFEAVGGLTMGADHFAHLISYLADAEWFVVRKQRKGRGTDKLIEGAALTPGRRVLLVDDVVTTGGSIEQAYHAVTETGAEVVAAVTLVDRGETARGFFDALGIPYVPIVTYRDLGIPRVGPDAGVAA